MTLTPTDFIGRFLRHVPPPGFRRIRSYGILAGAARAEKLTAARKLLGTVELVDGEEDEPEVVEPDRCPKCEVGTMHAIHSTPRGRPPPLAPPWTGTTRNEAA